MCCWRLWVYQDTQHKEYVVSWLPGPLDWQAPAWRDTAQTPNLRMTHILDRAQNICPVSEIGWNSLTHSVSRIRPMLGVFGNMNRTLGCWKKLLLSLLAIELCASQKVSVLSDVVMHCILFLRKSFSEDSVWVVLLLLKLLIATDNACRLAWTSFLWLLASCCTRGLGSSFVCW
jgi:hypothetical protein